MTTATLTHVDLATIAAAWGCKPAGALGRLAFLGYGEDCARCGGSGQFSFRADIGTACLGCGGRGRVFNGLTTAQWSECEARVTRGALTPYLDRARLAKTFGAEADKVLALFSGSRTFRCLGYACPEKAAVGALYAESVRLRRDIMNTPRADVSAALARLAAIVAEAHATDATFRARNPNW